MDPVKKGFWQVAALVAVQTILSLIVFAAILAILVFLLRKRIRKYKYIDMGIFERLGPYVSPVRNRIVLFITFLGNHRFLVPAHLLVILYFLFVRKESWFSIRVAVIGVSSLVLMLLLKLLFRRKRPLSPLLHAVKGLSFPSGHAILASTFYGLCIYISIHTMENSLVKYFLIALLVILILLIGFSRIYLRVHYASDVLAGIVVGFLWLSLSLGVLDRIENSLVDDSVKAAGIPSDL